MHVKLGNVNETCSRGANGVVDEPLKVGNVAETCSRGAGEMTGELKVGNAEETCSRGAEALASDGDYVNLDRFTNAWSN